MSVRSRLAAGAWGLAVVLALAPLPSFAEDPPAEKPVCGRDLMTSEELTAHRAKLRSLASREERAAYRTEHHAKMLARAKERGVELPSEGCPRGRGMGGPGGGGQGPRRP